MNPSTLAQQAPSLDVEPRLGQSDAGIDAWIKLNVTGGASNPRAPGLYAQKLYAFQAELGFDAWKAGLTDRQLELIDAAAEYNRQQRLIEKEKERNCTDPKVLAERQREKECMAAFRKTDPDYQHMLEVKRLNYADRKGGIVRPYTHKERLLTDAEKKADAKERVKQLNQRWQAEITAGRNPFDVSQFGSRDAMMNRKQDAMQKQVVRHQVCAALIEDGEIQIDSEVLAQDIKDLIKDIGTIAPIETGEIQVLIAGCVNSLRAAGVIQKRGQTIRLHKRIIDGRKRLDRARKDELALASVAHIPGAGDW